MPAAGGYAFGPYRLETQPLALRREGALVPLSRRQLAILQALVSRHGEILPKDLLISTGWRGVTVTDSSLGKMICQLRQQLDPGRPEMYIKTVPRHGYQFVAATAVERNHEDFSALLAPRRAWTEGRAALEILQGSQVPRALATFEQQLVHHPGSAEVHVGLANARVMQF